VLSACPVHAHPNDLAEVIDRERRALAIAPEGAEVRHLPVLPEERVPRTALESARAGDLTLRVDRVRVVVVDFPSNTVYANGEVRLAAETTADVAALAAEGAEITDLPVVREEGTRPTTGHAHDLSIRDGDPPLNETARRGGANGVLTVLDEMRRHPEAFASSFLAEIKAGRGSAGLDRAKGGFNAALETGPGQP